MKFNIVDGVSANKICDEIYDDFKKDFMNRNIKVSELKEKYGLSKASYSFLREKVLAETGLTQKPCNLIKKSKSTNLFKNKSNTYTIRKIINGKQCSFGTYADKETAIKVRDELEKANWDKNVAYKLKNKYSTRKKNTKVILCLD